MTRFYKSLDKLERLVLVLTVLAVGGGMLLVGRILAGVALNG